LGAAGLRYDVIREAVQQVFEELQETEPGYFILEEE
jgi:hypothetical protein